MVEESRPESAPATMRRINRAWLDGHVEDLAPLVHPEIVMVLPGFAGRVTGKEEFLAGFRDFCENARVHEFREQDYQVDVAGDTAVVTFRYDGL
jgi:prepilin-type processing-associated H-X9-DG protein